MSYVHIINTDALGTLKDNTHFDTPAQITLGATVADLMLGEMSRKVPAVAPR